MNKGQDLELLLQVSPDRVVSHMVDVRQTVGGLKRQIAEKHGYPPGRLILSVVAPPEPPQEMLGDTPLAQYNLVRRTTIYVAVADEEVEGPPPGQRLPPVCGIFVKVLRSQDADGRSLGPSVNEKDTVLEMNMRLTQQVGEMKRALARMCGFPANRQRLVFQGTEMQDRMTLVHYHVVPRSVIHLWPLTGEEE